MVEKEKFTVPKREKHLFVGRIQCLDGFFYKVTEDGRCSHCGSKGGEDDERRDTSEVNQKTEDTPSRIQ